MSPKLDEIFRELGISQYLDVFVDQGFDTWETILDITESDLDALGVKLGHRRKLQRRIANARGIAPNAVLNSPTRSTAEDARNEVQRPEVLAPPTSDGREAGAAVVQKRKYRRHPKPDECAPERPPSAYVLFSNKMREDLKGQNLTFTEIAKLVGENWQGLTQAEKEPYERQAQAAKEKYNQDLAEYKKTPEYKKYLQYLQDFKAKHASQPQEKEGAKRVRLSDTGVGESNSILNHLSRGGRAGSIGENSVESSARRQRIGSIVSNGESYYAPSILSASQPTPGEDFTVASPGSGYFDRRREHSPSLTVSPKNNSAPLPTLPLRKDLMFLDGPRNEMTSLARPLPSLSDIFDGRPPPNGGPYSADTLVPSFGMLPRGHQTSSPAPTPSISGSESRPPSLRKDQSSATSMSSGSSYNSSYPTPRTPVEGPLPIHALLSGGKQFGSQDAAIYRSMSPDDRGPPVHYPLERPPSDPTPGLPTPQINGVYSGHTLLPNHASPAPPARLTYQLGYESRTCPPAPAPAPASASALGPAPAPLPAPAPSARPGVKPDTGLDGISALLQADKFVDRR